MSNPIPDPDQVVSQHWPLHGPYSPEMLKSATGAVVELGRYLAHATGNGRSEALPHAADAYSAVGALSAAAIALEQTLRQLSAHVAELADEPTLAGDAAPGDPQATHRAAAGAITALGSASATAGALYHHLNTARSHLGSLYHRETPHA